LLCPACGGQMNILAFLTDPPVWPPQGDLLLNLGHHRRPHVRVDAPGVVLLRRTADREESVDRYPFRHNGEVVATRGGAAADRTQRSGERSRW
ncbi:MAG: hypothetical protein ACKVG4_08575, partial [Longimicrobiales bacterium]